MIEGGGAEQCTLDMKGKCTRSSRTRRVRMQEAAVPDVSTVVRSSVSWVCTSGEYVHASRTRSMRMREATPFFSRMVMELGSVELHEQQYAPLS